MSELADLLSRELAPGVYLWTSPADVADVQAEVEEAGWRFVHLETEDVTDKRSFLDRAAAAFGFPDWFGRNWDAFADSLGDVCSDEGTLVLWEGAAPFEQADERSFAVAHEVLRERAESELGGRFAVLLRPAGY